MKQIFLAAALIALPVAAFSGYEVYAANAAITANAAVASLGDLSKFSTIITDVQAIAATGDLGAAKARIKDFEIAWDDNAKGLQQMDPAHWGEIDTAADAALSALRAGTPDPVQVTKTLADLQTTMKNASQVSK